MKTFGCLTSFFIIAAALAGLAGAASGQTTRPSMERQVKADLQVWGPRFQEAGLRYLVAGPFILAGDGTAEQLAGYRQHGPGGGAGAGGDLFQERPARAGGHLPI